MSGHRNSGTTEMAANTPLPILHGLSNVSSVSFPDAEENSSTPPPASPKDSDAGPDAASNHESPDDSVAGPDADSSNGPPAKTLNRIYSEIDVGPLQAELSSQKDVLHPTTRSLSMTEPHTPDTPPLSAHTSHVDVTKNVHDSDSSAAVHESNVPGPTTESDDPQPRAPASQHQTSRNISGETTKQSSENDFPTLSDDVQLEIERLEEERRYVEHQVALAKRRASYYLESASGRAAVEYRHDVEKDTAAAATKQRNASICASLESHDMNKIASELFAIFDMDSDERFDTQDFRMLIDILHGAYADDSIHRAFLDFDSDLKDYWNESDFQRWFVSEHLKVSSLSLLTNVPTTRVVNKKHLLLSVSCSPPIAPC